MKYSAQNPFESIESAHNFVRLLAEAVADGKRDIQTDVERELDAKSPRRLKALRVAAYNLERLELHLNKSRRILNDLRSLRRLLFEERAAKQTAAPPKPVQKKEELPLPRKPEVRPPAVASAPLTQPVPSNGKAALAN